MGHEPRVAIVCDWLLGIGGAERVVLELHKLYPNAPIYTSQYDPEAIDWFNDADVRTTWLQKLPKALKKFLPVLRAYTFSRLDLSAYDLVISSSGAEAKAIKTGPNTVHISYCHAPTHYYWSRYEEYLAHPGFGKLDGLARFGLKTLVGPMRRWDRRAAQKPDYLIANSTHTARQIKKYYGRDASVVFPPVEVRRFEPSEGRSGFLIVGRQTPYKRVDLAVEACSRLGLPLTVIGHGPDHERLIAMAGPTINFETNASDEQVAIAMRSTKAFLFPGVDDFGIVAVEALAAGTPVIAYKGGGSLDYVKPGMSGLFFEEQTVGSLVAALEAFDPKAFNEKTIYSVAEQFSVAAFDKSIREFIAAH